MQYRRLGDAGMKVSAVSLGGWINFGEGHAAEKEARNIIEKSIELGINFFDIADVYGQGRAETQMGEIFKGVPRHTLVVSSKVFFPMSDEVNDRGLSRKHIFESIDKSLERLQMNYIDIYFCHRPDPETPIIETARAMNDLIQQGKVMYWGTSEWSAHKLAEAVDVCERYNLHPPKTEQPQYSMLYRDRVEREILPVTKPRGIGLVVWSPLAQGMLTGKYDGGIPDDSRFAREDWVKDEFPLETYAQKVANLKPIADELGITRAQLALAWVLRQPGVSCVITGATKVNQIEDNVQAAELKLSDDVLERIDAVLDA